MASDSLPSKKQAEPQANFPETINVKKEPQIGDSLMSGITVSSANQEMTGPGQIMPAFRIQYLEILYVICIDKDKRINYISTSDLSFKTPDGLKIGDRFEEALKNSAARVSKKAGWGYALPLKSGWNAGFFIGKNATDFNLTPNDTIKWFYKN